MTKERTNNKFISFYPDRFNFCKKCPLEIDKLCIITIIPNKTISSLCVSLIYLFLFNPNSIRLCQLVFRSQVRSLVCVGLVHTEVMPRFDGCVFNLPSNFNSVLMQLTIDNCSQPLCSKTFKNLLFSHDCYIKMAKWV